MEPAYKLLTVEDFLDSCPNDERHYQLIEGVIVAMAPPAIPHQIIAGNLTGEIYASLRATRPNCTVRSQAGVAPQGLLGRNHFETDITVTCEPGGYRGIAARDPDYMIGDASLPQYLGDGLEAFGWTCD